MEDEEVTRFIGLLTEWRDKGLNWGDCCELRTFKNQFSDAIEEYYQEWSSFV